MFIKRYRKTSFACKTYKNRILKMNKNHQCRSLASGDKTVKSSSKVRPLKKNHSKSSQPPVSKYHEDEQGEETEEDFENLIHIYLVRGRDTSALVPVWNYVAIEEENHEAFLSGVETFESIIDVADYGKVLYSGLGHDPPLHVVRNVGIRLVLPFFKKGLQKLGLNCTAIINIDNSE